MSGHGTDGDRHITLTEVAAPRAGSKERVLHADGEPWRTTSADALRLIDLPEGTVFEADHLLESLATAEHEAARARALRILDSRDRSAGELAYRLATDGYPSAVVHTIVERLVEVGIIDDARLAEAIVRSLSEGKGYGDRRIRQELRRRRIDDDTAEHALAQSDADSEDQRAHMVADRLARSVKDPRRLAERLVRRGFGWETARRAAQSALDAADDQADPGYLDRL